MSIVSKPYSRQGRDNWDDIFGKKKDIPKDLDIKEQLEQNMAEENLKDLEIPRALDEVIDNMNEKEKVVEYKLCDSCLASHDPDKDCADQSGWEPR